MKELKACIAVDIGNTRAKAARFEGSHIVERLEFVPEEFFSSAEGMDFFTRGIPVVMASVRKLEGFDLSQLEKNVPLLIINGNTEVPFQVDYESKNTLGADRLALVAGAISEYPSRDLLVVDAGTCITADLVLEGKRYAGGSISPGLKMRLQAMHEFTSRLPLIESLSDAQFPGRTTEESMIAGAKEGASLEIRKRAELLQQQYPGLSVILTGGDAPYFVKTLKNSIFASPDLVQLGLRMILEYYVRKNK